MEDSSGVNSQTNMTKLIAPDWLGCGRTITTKSWNGFLAARKAYYDSRDQLIEVFTALGAIHKGGTPEIFLVTGDILKLTGDGLCKLNAYGWRGTLTHNFEKSVPLHCVFSVVTGKLTAKDRRVFKVRFSQTLETTNAEFACFT